MTFENAVLVTGALAIAGIVIAANIKVDNNYENFPVDKEAPSLLEQRYYEYEVGESQRRELTAANAKVEREFNAIQQLEGE